VDLTAKTIQQLQKNVDEELKKKDVQFAGAPREEFYCIEAILKDGLGNWFSMTQPKNWQG
jgi:hypothetical protein